MPGTRPGIEITDDTTEELDPPFHLILLDDDEHTYQYVIHMLGAVFGHSKEKAFAIACMVDANGRAILLTAGHEEVERKQAALQEKTNVPASSPNPPVGLTVLEKVTSLFLVVGLVSLAWMILRATGICPSFASERVEIIVVVAIWSVLFVLVGIVGWLSTKSAEDGGNREELKVE